MKRILYSAACTLALLAPTFSYSTTNLAVRLVHPLFGQLDVFSDTHLDKAGGKATGIQRRNIARGAALLDATLIGEDGYSFDMDTFALLGLKSSTRSTVQEFLTNAREVFAQNTGIPAPYALKFADAQTSINPHQFKKKAWHDSYFYSPLNTLCQECRNEGVQAYSFDFQTPRQASEQGYPITIKEIVDMEQALIDLILADTTSPFKHYYQEFIDTYHADSGVKKLIALARKQPSLLYQDAKLQIGHLLDECHEEWLMNAYLLYLLTHQLKSGKPIIIYAGNAHTDAIMPALKAVGYRTTYEVGEEAWWSDDTYNQCILPVVDIKKFFEAAAGA